VLVTNRTQLKRAHSADPESASASSRKSPSAGPFTGGDAAAGTTPPDAGATATTGGGLLSSSLQPLSGASLFGKSLENDASTATVGSPLKKARPSIAGLDDVNVPQLGDVLAKAEAGEREKAAAAAAAGSRVGGAGLQPAASLGTSAGASAGPAGDAMEEEEEL
jgi:hypothetical protein